MNDSTKKVLVGIGSVTVIVGIVSLVVAEDRFTGFSCVLIGAGLIWSIYLDRKPR